MNVPFPVMCPTWPLPRSGPLPRFLLTSHGHAGSQPFLRSLSPQADRDECRDLQHPPGLPLVPPGLHPRQPHPRAAARDVWPGPSPGGCGSLLPSGDEEPAIAEHHPGDRAEVRPFLLISESPWNRGNGSAGVLAALIGVGHPLGPCRGLGSSHCPCPCPSICKWNNGFRCIKLGGDCLGAC